jgi:hypothetical protein
MKLLMDLCFRFDTDRHYYSTFRSAPMRISFLACFIKYPLSLKTFHINLVEPNEMYVRIMIWISVLYEEPLPRR